MSGKWMKLTCLSMAAAGTAFALVAAGSASAATATDTFQVTATVTANCSVTADDIAFGNYNVLTASNLQNLASSVDVTCTTGTTFTIALDAGSNAAGVFADRAMEENGAGTAKLQYQIYTEGTFTTVWGDGTGTTSTVSGTGAGPITPQAKTMFAEITQQQNVPAGGYTDATVTATVTF